MAEAVSDVPEVVDMRRMKGSSFGNDRKAHPT